MAQNLDLVRTMTPEFVDRVYDFHLTFFNIDKEMEQWIPITTAIVNLKKALNNHPELTNESDFLL